VIRLVLLAALLIYHRLVLCGRFNLTKPKDIEARFGHMDWHERRIEPRFNIAPTQEILTIVLGPEGERQVQMATWGLVPFWMRDKPAPQINARMETVSTSPMFRTALAKHRCLIPATGFYEWIRQAKTKTPMHIQLKDGGLFAFAGLWLPGKRDGLPTATIVTGVPNELVAQIHNRMPVILRTEDEAAWLDPSEANPKRLLRTFPAEDMHAYAVRPLVNSFQNEGPEVLEPAQVEQLRLQ
jgi:putative SOS response-associated peptidase YedK